MEKERDRRHAQQPDPSELEDWAENRILSLVIGTGVGGGVLRRGGTSEGENAIQKQEGHTKPIAVSSAQLRMSPQGIFSVMHANSNAYTSICKLYADGIRVSKNRKR